MKRPVSGEYTPSTPNPAAVKRVKNAIPVPDLCPNCGTSVGIAHHKDVYGQAYGEWPWLYRCFGSNCNSQVGMHPQTGIPLGTLATPMMRAARKTAKDAFNPLWQTGGMTRTAAYAWLANALGIATEQCHIGWFDVETCKRVMQVCAKTKGK